MLDHLGHPEAARRVEQAVATELAGRTPGAPLRTAEVGDRLAAARRLTHSSATATVPASATLNGPAAATAMDVTLNDRSGKLQAPYPRTL